MGDSWADGAWDTLQLIFNRRGHRDIDVLNYGIPGTRARPHGEGDTARRVEGEAQRDGGKRGEAQRDSGKEEEACTQEVSSGS